MAFVRVMLGPVRVAAFVVAMCGSAMANPFSGLWNTGVDANGNPQANGASEIHYTQFNPPSGAATGVSVDTAANAAWVADNSISAWIGPNSGGSLNGPVGDYAYQTTFYVNSTTAMITGEWAAAGSGGGILLNGNNTGAATSSFGQWTDFTINTGFVIGLNTLTFVVGNYSAGPTGVRVQMTGRAVPEPASLALLIPALLCLYTLRRRL